MSNLNTPLGGAFDSRPPDSLPGQLEADRQASRAASDLIAWSSLDTGRKDFSNAKSGQTAGSGVNVVGWLYHAKTASAMEGYSFKGAELSKANAANIPWTNCDFRNCNMTGTDFSGAVLENCQFDEGTKFDGGSLKGAQFINCTGAEKASFKDTEFNAFAFVSDPRMGRNSIGLLGIPPGALLISDEQPRQEFGVDRFATR